MKKIMTRLLSLVLLGAFIPSFVLAETWDLGKGDITVTATETSQTVSQVNGETKDDPDPRHHQQREDREHCHHQCGGERHRQGDPGECQH